MLKTPKACNGQDVFLKKTRDNDYGPSGLRDRGSRMSKGKGKRDNSMPRWRAARSRSPPQRYGGKGGKGGKGGDWGMRAKGGMGYGIDEWYGKDDWEEGFWAGFQKGCAKGRAKDRVADNDEFRSFGSRNKQSGGGGGRQYLDEDSGRGSSRKGKGKGKGSLADRDKEPDQKDLDSELNKYFGKEPAVSSKKNGKTDPDAGALDSELDKYMAASGAGEKADGKKDDKKETNEA